MHKIWKVLIKCLSIIVLLSEKTFEVPLLELQNVLGNLPVASLADTGQLGNQLSSLTSVLSLDFKKGSKSALLSMLDGSADKLKTPDGRDIKEGDIVETQAMDKDARSDGDLWPDAKIPFMFHPSVDGEHQSLILESIKHWEENTCIRFKPKTSKDKIYVRFRTDTPGCWSSVGRQFHKPGPQDISIGSGCFKFYTAVHEIGHTIGYFHEHARKDRDEFVHIRWNNIKEGLEGQFHQRSTRNQLIPYDYRSVMHYPAWAFSKKPLKDNVVLSKNPFVQWMIDEEKTELSFRDIKLTNMLYKCSDSCPAETSPVCENDGILVPPFGKKKKTCRCICKPGFEGKLCNKIDQDNKIHSDKPKCGGNVTNEGDISTPNYPKREEDHESCSYWITAPPGKKVQVNFLDFSFAPPYGDDPVDQLCLYETVEIRNSDDIYDGKIYCGEQIAANTTMESIGRHFIIIIVADNQKRGRGLKVKVNFVADEQATETKSRGLLSGLL